MLQRNGYDDGAVVGLASPPPGDSSCAGSALQQGKPKRSIMVRSLRVGQRRTLVYGLPIGFSLYIWFTSLVGLLYQHKEVFIMQHGDETEDPIIALREENRKLKQQCAALQQEIEDLRASEAHYRTTADVISLKEIKETLRVQQELAVALSATNDLDTGLNLVLDRILQLDAIDCGGIYLPDPQREGFDLVVHRGLSADFVASSAHIAPDSPQAALVRSGTPVYRPYSTLTFVTDERRKEGLRALAAIPILHDEAVIACLNLASHTHDDIPLQTRVTLEAIAAQIGSTIARIAAETALHESQRNFQTLFDRLQDMVFVLGTDGTVLYANPAVEHTLGYPSTELRGISVLDLHPDDRRDEVTAVFAALVRGETEICTIPAQTRDGVCISVETRLASGVWDGQAVLFGITRDMTRWMEAEAALREAQEQLEERVQERTAQLFTVVEELHREIGERQQVEKALRRSEARYREIIDLISDSVYSVHYNTDGSTELEWGFNSLERLTGYTADEISIHTWQQIVHPDDLPLVAQHFERLLAGNVSEVEYRVVAKQGDIRWMHDRAQSVWDKAENRVVRLYGAVADITERRQAEEALHSNLRFLETLLDTIPSPVFAKDIHGHYTACNQRFASQILGLEKAEIIGRTIFDLPQVVPPSLAPLYHIRDQELMQNPGMQTYEAEVRRADGSLRNVVFYKATFGDSSGAMVGIVGIIHDITDYNLAKEALIRAETFKQAILDSLTDHIAVLDESGTVVAVNQAWCSFADANPPINGSIAEGANYYQICESVEGPGSEEAARVTAGIRAVFAGMQETFTMEYACHLPDEQRWFVCRVTRFAASNLGYAVVSHQEITERKQMEEVLRESESLFRSLFDHLPVGVAMGNPDYQFARANAAFCRITGYTEHELLSLSLSDVTHPEDLQSEIVLAQQLVTGAIDQYSMDKRYIHKSGRIVWVRLSVRLIWKADGLTHYGLGVIEDITERKHMEHALRESEERLRLVLDATNDGMWDWHIPSGEVYYSPRWQTMLGYEPGELAGHVRTWETLLHPDDRAHAMQLVRDYMHEHSASYDIEFRLLRKDGGWQWILARGKLVEWDNQGRPVRMIGTHTDIASRKEAEAQLRESEANLARAHQMAKLGSFRHNLRTDEVLCSCDLSRMIGFGDEEIRQSLEDVRRIIHPDDHARFEEMLQQVVYAAGKAAIDLRVFKVDGTIMVFHEQIEAVCDDQGNVVEIFGAAQDITERKQMEHALRESEERYRMLAENMRDVVWTLDRNGRFTYVSPSIYQLRGYTAEEVMRQELHEVLTPDSLTVVRGRMWQSTPNTIGRVELEQPCKDGSTVWTESVVVPLLDAESQVTGWLGVSRDISERRRAETQVRQQAARVEALSRIATRLNAQLDLTTILTAVCVETHQALQVDMAIIALYDKQRDAMVFASGSGVPAELVPYLAVVPCELIDTSEPVRVFSDVIQEPGAFPNLRHLMALDMRSMIRVLVQRDTEMVGMILGFVAGAARLFTHDEQLLMRGIGDLAAQAIANARLFDEVQQERALLSRRVAERTADLSRSNAELARAVRAKDEFLANMSHELRTPLNAILGLSEALQEEIYGPLNARQQQSLATIERSGQHLLSLINDILDLSKIEAERVGLELETISIEAVCQASLQFVRQQAMKKHITISLCMDPALVAVTEDKQPGTQGRTMSQVTIQADERRLKQILVNLLTNAVKFTLEGGQVGLDVSADSDPYIVHFTVWDTGIGIAPEDQRRLFQPFIQVDSSLSREHDGTGLGLALVMRLTELHGGSVTLESDVGKGSRFTISLPQFEPVYSPAQDVEDNPTPSFPQTQLPQHVLIIEDSPGSIEQMMRYLNEMGINSVYAADGAQALSTARESPPDLIVLDILLTDVSGWDVLRACKSDAATRDIPVLVVSVVDEKARGMALGAAGYLVKPVSRQHIQDAIHAIFSSTVLVAEAAVSSPATTPQPLILLAEDNEMNITTVSDFLHTKGYEVVIARNGLEAVVYADEQQPRLILMDIQMPKMDGLEAMRRIRTNARLAHVPIIALTALAMQGDRERCIEAGANEYLSKPVRLRELSRMIAAFLRDEMVS